MTRKSRRLVLIASAVAVIGVAVGLVLFALRGNVSFFYSPTEYAEKAPAPGTRLSVGGLVKNDTVVKGADKTVTFTVTDTSLVTGVAPLIGALRRDAALMDVARPAAFAQFLLVAGSFAALRIRINVENSHSKPMIYKVSGVWGNHEGSMLLWVLILALFGAPSRFRPASCRAICARCAGGAGWIAVAFLSFILLTSNPFARAAMPPIEGNDLNPILQDPASRFIRRCSTSAMSASRSPSPSPSPR
jgi:hypothetical protein